MYRIPTHLNVPSFCIDRLLGDEYGGMNGKQEIASIMLCDWMSTYIARKCRDKEHKRKKQHVIWLDEMSHKRWAQWIVGKCMEDVEDAIDASEVKWKWRSIFHSQWQSEDFPKSFSSYHFQGALRWHLIWTQSKIKDCIWCGVMLSIAWYTKKNFKIYSSEIRSDCLLMRIDTFPANEI